MSPVVRHVLVTGASGFVGLAALRRLLHRGHHVIATATALAPQLPAADNLEWIVWDARREPLPRVDWSGLHVILHLAAPRSLFDFPAQAAAIYELAVAATFRLLEAARQHGVRRVLVASTADVLGSSPGPAGEDDCTYMPSSFYGATKACAEVLLRAYGSELETGVLRLFHPYGPGGDRFLINRLVRAVAEGREVTIEGPDGIVVNPIWTEDLACGLCAAVESRETGVFHFAGPDTLTLRALLELAGELAHRAPVIRHQNSVGVQRHWAGYERTARALEFRPRVGIREGVASILAALGPRPAA